MNLEALLCHEHGFQLTTATPLQRAICRMETGEPLEELAQRDDVRECIGGAHALNDLPDCAPSTSVLMAAVRTAKSQKAAAKAFRATQICNLDKLKDGEKAVAWFYQVLRNVLIDHVRSRSAAASVAISWDLGSDRVWRYLGEIARDNAQALVSAVERCHQARE